jgi:hypothetical protein
MAKIAIANEPFNTHRVPYPSKLETPTNAPIRAAFQKLPVRKNIATTETKPAQIDRSSARSSSVSICEPPVLTAARLRRKRPPQTDNHAIPKQGQDHDCPFAAKVMEARGRVRQIDRKTIRLDNGRWRGARRYCTP